MSESYSLPELKDRLRTRRLDLAFYNSLDQPKQAEACERDITRIEKLISNIKNNTED